MLLNYIKLSFRLMVRSPFFTFINVAGLSLGFAVFFILWPYTQSQLKGDAFIPDHDKIVRPLYVWHFTDDGGSTWGQVLFPRPHSHISSEMKEDERVLDVTRLMSQSSFNAQNSPGLKPELIFSIGDAQLEIGLADAVCVDQNFLEFFDLPLLEGNPHLALALPESVVISEHLAKTLYQGSAAGQSLIVNGKHFTVTAVMKDLPAGSHFQFKLIFSNISRLNFWNSFEPTKWNLCYHYFKMDRPDELVNLLEQSKQRLLGAFLDNNPHVRVNFQSQTLDDIAFTPNTYETFHTKSKLLLRSLSVVSVVVLIMAWMNYINLAVSRTRTRFKEMAARKAVGALLPDLALQFICQSLVINLLAVLIGATLIQLVKSPFEYFFGFRILSIVELDAATFTFFTLVFGTGVVLTACYPAWITLRHTTHQLITRRVPGQNRLLTTLLTTTQYVAAIAIIVWVFVMHAQLDFILTKDLGINKEDVIVLRAPLQGLEENGSEKMAAFAERIRFALGGMPVTLSYRVCGEPAGGFNVRRIGTEGYSSLDSHGGVDEHFLEFYGIRLIAGRNFIKDEKANTAILSRYACERIGFRTPEEAVGQIIESDVAGKKNVYSPVEVIGVVEDYRSISFYDSEGSSEQATGRGIGLTYCNPRFVPNRLSLRLNTDQVAPVMNKIKAIYDKEFPGNAFHWFFLDENITSQYSDQLASRNQLTLFSSLAIVVACLGLLGMVSNAAVEKLKDISVRRILGATSMHVSALLLTSTFRQVAVAVAVGLPIAWKFSSEYLQKYTHKIELSWWHFTVPVLMLAGMMLASVVSVLWRASHTNVSEVLKHE